MRSSPQGGLGLRDGRRHDLVFLDEPHARLVAERERLVVRHPGGEAVDRVCVDMRQPGAEPRGQLGGPGHGRSVVPLRSGRVDLHDDDVVLRDRVDPFAVHLRTIDALRRGTGGFALGARGHEGQRGHADDDPDGAGEVPVHLSLLFVEQRQVIPPSSRMTARPRRDVRCLRRPHRRSAVSLHAALKGVKMRRSCHASARQHIP